MIRTTILLSLLAAATMTPFAAADETCVGTFETGACTFEHKSQRFSSSGAYVYDMNTFTVVALSMNEGYGFFGYTRTTDAFVYSGVAGQYVTFVSAENDGYPSDGEYEEGGMALATWNDNGAPAAFAELGYSDSDGDGKGDAGGASYGAGFALLP